MPRNKRRKVVSHGSPYHRKKSRGLNKTLFTSQETGRNISSVDRSASIAGSVGNTDNADVVTANMGNGGLGAKLRNSEDNDVQVEDKDKKT
eukprot:15326614-Ditylum_brightwellii.AAC.1